MSARVLVVDDSPTIRKVVASILEASSYEPVPANDGQQALEILQAGGHFDLVLLDFVMPRMNGYQFCRRLREHPEHRGLPVVLMSAKGDKIRGQFVQQTGAIDAITKPFDARGLIAVIEGALKKHREGRARPLPDVMPEDDLDLDAADNPSSSRVNLSEDPGLRRVQAAQEFGLMVGRATAPKLLEVQGVTASTEALAEAIQDATSPELVGNLAALLRTASFGADEHEALSGDLSVISIAEVLQLLSMQRQSGALSVFTRQSEVTLYLSEGNLDFAGWRGLRDEFLIGRYLVAAGALEREELQHVLDNRAGSRRLLGEQLVQLGLVTEEQVRTALVAQTSELVYELVRWSKGRFSFHIQTNNPIAEQAALGLPAGALVMEGFRRVDEWRLIEGSFDFDEVLYRDQLAIDRLQNESELTAKERAVLNAIDGERTVREIVEEVGGSSFELCKILFQFLNSRLVRRKAA